MAPPHDRRFVPEPVVPKADTANSAGVSKRAGSSAAVPPAAIFRRECQSILIPTHLHRTASAMQARALQYPGKTPSSAKSRAQMVTAHPVNRRTIELFTNN
jgi:hypothetical protein